MGALGRYPPLGRCLRPLWCLKSHLNLNYHLRNQNISLECHMLARHVAVAIKFTHFLLHGNVQMWSKIQIGILDVDCLHATLVVIDSKWGIAHQYDGLKDIRVWLFYKKQCPANFGPAFIITNDLFHEGIGTKGVTDWVNVLIGWDIVGVSSWLWAILETQQSE